MGNQNGTSEEKSQFEYSIGGKDDVLVILFRNKMTGKDLEQLEACRRELLSGAQRVILFDFSQVSRIMPGVYEFFAKLLKDLRGQEKFFALCSFQEPALKDFTMAGLVRQPELFPSIPAGWKEMQTKLKNHMFAISKKSA